MIINILLSIISGVLLILAFPKFNLFWIVWIALVPFFLALNRAGNWRQALVCGFFFGLTFFGGNLFWVTTLWRFVKWWSLLGWACLVIFQTIFILLFAVLTQLFMFDLPKPKLARSPEKPAASALVARGGRTSDARGALKNIFYAGGIAFIWAAIEWLRAWGPFGVTAGDLGYSQVPLLPLIQIARFTSVYGVSFLIALVNIALAIFLLSFHKWQALALALLLVILTGAYGWQVLYLKIDQEKPASLAEILRQSPLNYRFLIIQPNIDQQDKLDPAKVEEIFVLQGKMTRQAIDLRPDIIIWPETAVLSYLLYDQGRLERLKKLAQDADAWMVLGTPHYLKGKAYNSLISISPAGRVVSRYDKQQLVPFGEYLPFRPLLYPLLKHVGYYENGFASNPKPKQIQVGELRVAAAICFESAFPALIRRRVGDGSDFILLLTNDAWFGDSAALFQHFNNGIFRAIENRQYFIQVGNTGISALIDPYGRVIKQTKANQRQILTFEIPLS